MTRPLTTTTRQVCATAHRGDVSRHRENTLPAIRSAIEAGAEYVEVDVRVTGDGQVVLLHDRSLQRLWGLDLDIDQVLYEELSALGSGEERIPLLAEALDLFADCSGSELLIDMDEAAPAAAAHAVVTAAGSAVSWCGHLDAMRIIRGLDPAARIWLPWNHRTAPPQDLLTELAPVFVNSEHVILTREIVDRIHASGTRVACWTVDDPDAMRWVLDLGVDSVTSNRLALLQRVIGEGPGRWNDAQPPAALTGAETLLALEVARDLARWAIDYTRNALRGSVSTKAHPADLVTEVDVAIERHVRDVIAARLPGHLVVGEELGGTSEAGTPCWYLDPVDGTTNYVNKFPWSAFSLALAIDRTPLVAVVADPWRGDLFEAVAGHGARLNGEPLILEPGTSRDGSLAGAVVATELAGHRPWPGMLELLEELGDRHSIMRIMGSATLSVTGVAAGRGTGAIIGTFSPIDHLAGALLVTEAGGLVLDSDGKPDPFPESGGILASTRGAAAELYGMWSHARARAEDR